MLYKELLNLGFSRREYHDDVFFDCFGFKPFVIEFIRGNINLTWSVLEKEHVKFYINDRFYKKLESIEEVKEIVKLFN